MIGQILVASLWLATIIARLAVASWTATCKQRNINTHKLYRFPLNITSHSDNRKSSKGLFCVLKCARQTNEGTLVYVSWSLTSYFYQMIIARQISDIIKIKYHSMFTYPVYMTKFASYINSGISTSATYKLNDVAKEYCDTANQSLLTIKLTLLTHIFNESWAYYCTRKIWPKITLSGFKDRKKTSEPLLHQPCFQHLTSKHTQLSSFN